MRRVNLNLLILVLVIVVVAVLKGRKATSAATVPVTPSPAAADVARVIAVASPGRPGKAIAAPVLTIVPKLELKPEPFAQELAQYAVLKKKIFLTSSEDSERKLLLTNEKLLRGMRSRLMRSPATAQEAMEQNAAIDLLLDAVRTGDNEVAIDVLRSVVTDGQVEDESLDRTTRENLAGIKAEVLFQWSALKPAQASELAGLLPGPVSQRIWQNVVDAQQSNLNESAALAH
jgi:hypothetical protein